MIRKKDINKSSSRFKPSAVRGLNNAVVAGGGDAAEQRVALPGGGVGVGCPSLEPPPWRRWRDPEVDKDELLLDSFRTSLYVDGLLLRLRQCTALRQEDELRPLAWTKRLIRSEAFVQPMAEHALLDAAATGSTNEVAQLLASGANANASNSSGWTALHCASASGHSAVVALLVRAGAIVERHAGPLARVTPLALAVFYGRTACVQSLLQARANPSARVDVSKHSLLTVAVARGHWQCVVPLVRAGAEVDAKEEDGATAMHVAAAEGHVDCIKVLASEWADIEARTNNGWTPLHVAARCGHAPAVDALLSLGVEIDAPTGDEGRTALQCCSLSAKDGCFDALLEAGADTAHRDKFGVTLLHEAAGRGCVDILRAALEAGGGALDSRTSAGWTPLFAAVVADRFESAHLLLECSRSSARAAGGGGGRAPRGEVTVTVVAEVPDRSGLSPLHVAVMHKSERMMRLLVRHGAPVAATTQTGHTPLHLAASQAESVVVAGGVEASASASVVLELLLAMGAPVDVATTAEGETPLHAAALAGNAGAARRLLAAGASTSARDRRGRRPADCATNDAVRRVMEAASRGGNGSEKYGGGRQNGGVV